MSRIEIATQEALFDLLAANLSACVEAGELLSPYPSVEEYEVGSVILCPLCLRPFVKVDIHSKDLTPEHIVPSGGDGEINITLSCRKCNNKTGSRLDSHLRKRVIYEENFHRDGGPTRIRFSCGDGEQNARLYIRPGGDGNPIFHIEGLPTQSNPYLQNQLIQALTSDEPRGAKGQIYWNLGYVHALSQTAMLRSAYLAMFRQFGYSYILHPTLAEVREQIWRPFTNSNSEPALTHPHLLGAIGQTTEETGFEDTQIVWLTSPEQGFCVVLRLSKELPYRHSVPMPVAREKGSEFLIRLCQRADESFNERFSFAVIDFPPSELTRKVSCHVVRRVGE